MGFTERIAEWFGGGSRARTVVVEAADVWGDDDGHLYRPAIAGGDARQPNDITETERAKQRRIARQMYFVDPVGGGILDALVARVIGAGVTFIAADSDVQKVIDGFVGDPDNDLGGNLERFAKELQAFGELFIPIALNPVNADVKLGYLDPDDIEDIVWKRGDKKKALAFIERPDLTGKRRLWVIPHPSPLWGNHYPPHPALTAERERFAVNDELGQQIVLPNDGKAVLPEIQGLLDKYGDAMIVAGYAFYHRTGGFVSGRGRGIYERIGSWCKQVGDFMFGQVRNLVLQQRYFMECIVDGGDEEVEAKVDELQKSPPVPGGVIVHSNREQWNMLSPDLSQASNIDTVMQSLLGIIGISVNMPPHELSDEGGATRSTAAEARSVSINRAKRFQREIAAMLRAWIGYAIDQKVHRKQLPGVQDTSFDVILPELDARDETETANALQALTLAMVTALDRDRPLILEADARALLYSLAGLPVPSADDFEKALEDEAQLRAAAAYSGTGGLNVADDEEEEEDTDGA